MAAAGGAVGLGHVGRRPQVAVDPQGDAMVVSTEGPGLVKAAYRPAGARRFTTPEIVATAGGVQGLQVAMDRGGDATVIWQQTSPSSGHTVVMAAVRRRGDRFGAAQQLSDDGYDAARLALAVAEGGAVIAAWLRWDPQLWDGWPYMGEAIEAAARDTGDSRFSDPTVISDGRPKLMCAVAPQVAMDPAGDAVVLWNQNPPADDWGCGLQANTRP